MTQANKRAPAPQQRRPAAPQRKAPAPSPRKSGRGGSDLPLLIIICVVIAAAGLLLQMIWPNGFPIQHSTDTAVAIVSQVSEIYSDGPLRINEIMTSNRSTISMDGDESPDWIEIMNVSDRPVNLKGYTLSKQADDVRTFTFPELTLEANACALVYADSRLRDAAGEDLHAPFRLSSAGDTLMLFNAGGSAVDTVNIVALNADQSYIRTDTYTWQTCDAATPGLTNTQESFLQLQQPVEGSPVVISEIMSTNASTYPDENQHYHDYIELYNRSEAAVDLAGWYLTDDPTSLRKWRIPQLTLQSGECIVIHASKLDRKEDPQHLHTNFGLSSEGETVLLVGPDGRIRDRVEFGLLKADVAYTLNGDSWVSNMEPTPGRR